MHLHRSASRVERRVRRVERQPQSLASFRGRRHRNREEVDWEPVPKHRLNKEPDRFRVDPRNVPNTRHGDDVRCKVASPNRPSEGEGEPVGGHGVWGYHSRFAKHRGQVADQSKVLLVELGLDVARQLLGLVLRSIIVLKVTDREPADACHAAPRWVAEVRGS